MMSFYQIYVNRKWNHKNNECFYSLLQTLHDCNIVYIFIYASTLFYQWYHYIFSKLIFVFLLPGIQAEEVSGCYGDTMEISCPLGQRINILGDFYGLSKSKKCTYKEDDVCVVPTFGHTSMSKQVCNGRTSCVYTVSERHNCFKGDQQTNYQQIKYECIQGEQILKKDLWSIENKMEWKGNEWFVTYNCPTKGANISSKVWH